MEGKYRLIKTTCCISYSTVMLQVY